eukprot:CAMPEP_0171102190 /NCGR_PEP_ID=MMETSP0766_2-20121228/57114_1 /TAXON_ID=439317 /ORGANISM="Gambierdiscus australes, Strain CAWD 149" /LENGTH=99 /DNA_ID=CAMNT_0011562425 /DNA_START=203 /DNA_END=498 /DNA_ORIENTATION=+
MRMSPAVAASNGAEGESEAKTTWRPPSALAQVAESSECKDMELNSASLGKASATMPSTKRLQELHLPSPMPISAIAHAMLPRLSEAASGSVLIAAAAIA